MKSSTKIFFKTLIISMLVMAVFVSAGYFYIEKKIYKTENKLKQIPYTQEYLKNKGILFEIGGRETFIYLDFENEKVIASINPEKPIANEIYGYNCDYKICGNTNILQIITDYLDGLEFEIEGEILRYTGMQVKEMFEKENSKDFKRMLITKIFERIENRGVQTDFLGLILENSDTDLKLPDCYFWGEELQKISTNLQIID